MTNDDLCAWRKRLCLSQVAAAKTLGVSRRTYIRREMLVGDIPRIMSLACRAVEYDEILAPSLEALVEDTVIVRTIGETLLSERVFLWARAK